MHKLFFQSSYFSTIYSIRTWTNTQKHVFLKLRFTHPKPIWFLLSKLPNFTKLSISSILFNDFSFSHHITIKLLTKMFLIYFLYAKNSFPVTHIYDPFKRAYHSLSDLSFVCGHLWDALKALSFKISFWFYNSSIGKSQITCLLIFKVPVQRSRSWDFKHWFSHF